jgi:hydroxyacylglutathione hydrolase
MILESFPVGPLRCNCTILGDEVTHEAMVVDPGENIPEILSRLQKHGLTLRQIVVTHAHIDHVGGAALLKKLTGAPVFLNKRDLGLLSAMEMQAGWLGVPTPEVAPPDASADDGLAVGLTVLPGEVIHTPGHTPGSICLLFPEQHLLLAGDTLFAGSIGGPIYPGATGGRFCAPCVIAFSYFPTRHEWYRGMGRKRLLARKDNRIHSFSQNSECDTLSSYDRPPICAPNVLLIGSHTANSKNWLSIQSA